MTTKQKVLKEIEEMPPELLGDIMKFIKNLKKKALGKKDIPKFSLGGQCDDGDIRKKAYE